MNLPFFVARKYLFSRKRKTIINIISWISLIGIAVGSMALIVVLSVYNGIGNLTQSLFNVFDPELVIEPRQGKSFHTGDAFPLQQIKQTEGVASVSEILEENAWVIYKQNEQIAMLRGVDRSYLHHSGLQYKLSDTLNYDLGNYGGNYGVLLGSNLYWALGVNYLDQNTPLVVHIPKRKAGIGLTIDDAFNTRYAMVLDFFSVQNEIDSKYGVADIGFVRELLDYSPDEVSFLALSVDSSYSVKKVKRQLQAIVGDNFRVKDRFEQQPLYYKIYSSERLGIFLILSLIIIIIASLSLIASPSLLIIDKRDDNRLMQCLGATKATMRRIFFVEGVLISVVGVFIGLAVGFVVCFVQQQFGIVKMGDGNFIVDAFPVAMHLTDFVVVFALVIVLSMASVWFTVRRAKF